MPFLVVPIAVPSLAFSASLSASSIVGAHITQAWGTLCPDEFI